MSRSVTPAAASSRPGGHLDALVNNAGITGPVRDDPRDYTADDMTEAVARFTHS
jgi:NAD(P)-dependent dehydrogenase (short-subunit alcohol dehydrogenase family)